MASCSICSTKTQSSCLQCQKPYCSRKCQKKDWLSGHHKACSELFTSTIHLRINDPKCYPTYVHSDYDEDKEDGKFDIDSYLVIKCDNHQVQGDIEYIDDSDPTVYESGDLDAYIDNMYASHSEVYVEADSLDRFVRRISEAYFRKFPLRTSWRPRIEGSVYYDGTVRCSPAIEWTDFIWHDIVWKSQLKSTSPIVEDDEINILDTGGFEYT